MSASVRRKIKVVWTRLRVTFLVCFLTLLYLTYEIFPDLGLVTGSIIGIVIVAGTGFTEYSRKNQSSLNVQHRRERLFDYFCHGYIEDLREHDETARIMVLAGDRWPVEQWSTLRNIFSRYMEGHDDKHLGLNITQGVCGEAVTKNAFVAADLEAEHASTYRLSEDQLKRTKDLTLVMSMPIRKAETGDDGKPTLTDEIIGVINIDSRMPGALEFYEDDSSGDSLFRKQKAVLAKVSEIGSYIMS